MPFIVSTQFYIRCEKGGQLECYWYPKDHHIAYADGAEAREKLVDRCHLPYENHGLEFVNHGDFMKVKIDKVQLRGTVPKPYITRLKKA